MKAERIVAVVVTRNRLEKLTHCLDAIRRQTEACAVLVVNNNSTDGTGEWLRKQVAVDFLELAENTGCAGGFYHGIQKALELGAEWVWLMDDDVLPEPEALSAMLESRTLVPHAGLFCSNVFLPDGTADNPPILASGQSGFSWKDHLEVGLVRVWACTFTSVLISREMVLRAGLPLKQMFIWSDDIEYTSRLIACAPGYLVGKSRVVHMRTAQGVLEYETDADRVGLYYFEYRNRVYVARKRGGEFAWRSSSRTLLTLARLWGKPLFFRKLVVIMRGSIAGLFFSPEPEFWRGEDQSAE